jgi:PTS system glucitol/sorbitol-specific IIA component
VVRYDTRVTEVGPQVEEFVAAGILVFFRDDAPEELRAFSVLHRPTVTTGGLVPGDVLVIDGHRLRITAVGDVADVNLVRMGHVSLKANGATEAPLPGDLCVERGPLPQVPVGAHVAVIGGEATPAAAREEASPDRGGPDGPPDGGSERA